VKASAALAALAAVALAAGCGGSKEAFIGSRSRDACNQTWPVCDRVVGCIMGGQTYLTGRFPSRGSFMIHLSEASAVKVGIFIDGVAGTGTDDSYIHWWEDGCSRRIRESATAVGFVGEMDKSGVFERTADLVGIGDHLIEFFSDAQAEYYVKVDVVAKRDQAQ
jgi:hypothetical protein